MLDGACGERAGERAGRERDEHLAGMQARILVAEMIGAQVADRLERQVADHVQVVGEDVLIADTTAWICSISISG